MRAPTGKWRVVVHTVGTGLWLACHPGPALAQLPPAMNTDASARADDCDQRGPDPIGDRGAPWRTLFIPKTTEEKESYERLYGFDSVATGQTAKGRPFDASLPPRRDSLRFGAGLGYLQGADGQPSSPALERSTASAS